MIVHDMDQISNLPDPIMEQILFRYLPASDSIRMSFASRTWQRLWKSLPVSDDFDFDVRRDGRLDESMEEIVTSVDESLRILHEHEVRKHIIPSFSLRGRFSDEIQTSHVDRWLKLVTKHYVKRLVFYNYGIRWYKFPPAAFDVGSLVALSLYKCVLKRDLIQGKMSSFCCLKELELTFVDLNGLIIGDLLSRCPSLEKLKLNDCEQVKYLELLDFPKLKKLCLYRVKSKAFKYKIESASLQALSYSDTENPLDLEAVCCSNLEKLKLYTYIVTNQNIDDFIRKFPCLAKLVLEAEWLTSADDEIKISSNQLKSLTLNGDTDNKNINIDAPNLVSYHREAMEIPPSFSFNFVKLETHNHVFYDIPSLHTKWFLKLREYLAKFKPATASYLRLCCPRKAINISFRKLRQEKIPPVPKITKLVLNSRPSSLGNFDYTALIDGLLWSCHPTMIWVPRQDTEPNSSFIKFLYRILTDRGIKPSCCRDSHNKCWRHYLKSVELKGPFGTKDGKTAVYNKYSAMSLINSEQVEEATFELKW